jgi:hypothetical protein
MRNAERKYPFRSVAPLPPERVPEAILAPSPAWRACKHGGAADQTGPASSAARGPVRREHPTRPDRFLLLPDLEQGIPTTNDMGQPVRTPSCRFRPAGRVQGWRSLRLRAQYLVGPNGHIGFRCAGRDHRALASFLGAMVRESASYRECWDPFDLEFAYRPRRNPADLFIRSSRIPHRPEHIIRVLSQALLGVAPAGGQCGCSGVAHHATQLRGDSEEVMVCER